jgi:DNA mismatch repair protein MutS
VISRARTILRNLEGSDLTVHGSPAGRVSRSDPQLTLFELKDDALRAALDAVDLDRITPLEAMRLLAELKNLRRDQ